MRRRRTAVAAIAAAVLAATVGLAAVLVVQTQANSDRSSRPTSTWPMANQRASDANRDLLLANTRERARFDLALEAIKTFHGEVSEDLLLKEKQFDGLRTKLLTGATDFYERLEDLLKVQADRRSRAALGKAYHDIGELTAKIGSQSEAQPALKRGLELRLALAAEPDADPRDQAGSRPELDRRRRSAGGDRRSGRGAGSRTSRRATSSSRLARSNPEHAPYRAAVAKCLHGIARVQYQTGRAQDSLASHEQAR